MVFSVTVRLCLLIAAVFFTLLIASIVAQIDEYEPEVEPIGHHPGGLVNKGSDHNEEGGDEGRHHGEEGGETGPGEDDPAHIVSEALLCFSEKHIYSECDESYRLSETGELHVPFNHVNEFCTGPCFEETNLMLHCLDGVMEHFLFFNKATTRDVKDTIVASCSLGGDLDVGEHMEGDESTGSKPEIHPLFGIGTAIIGLTFYLIYL